MRKIFVIPLIFSFGCSSISTLKPEWQDNAPMEKEHVSKVDYSPSLFESFVEKVTKKDEIPLELEYDEKLYNFWIKYYTKKKNLARFSRHLTNGEKFKGIVHQIYREEGLPEDLFYVGLIESGFNTHIKSHASAKGPWQFMKGTAKDYGLRVDRWVDERTNIHKATRAAAHYFKDLYNIFGSWELALCAYNAGENRIIRAIRKGNTRNYRELVKKRLIPKETTYYIPKVAAAMEMAKNRKRYGINVQKNHSKRYEEAVVLKVKKPFGIEKVGRDLGISQATLLEFNPDIKTGWVHITSRRAYRLILPKSVKQKLAYTKIGGGKMPKSLSQRQSKGLSTYKVKRGDNLISISRKVGVYVKDIKRLNGLKSNKIFVGQRLKLTHSKKVARTSKKAVKRAPANYSKSPATYKVRKGDNLSLIAKRYNTSIRDLKKRNGLKSTVVRVGQRIKVPRVKTKLYVVKKGDNLTKISRRFGVPIARILSFNAMRTGAIFPKQKLHIPLNS